MLLGTALLLLATGLPALTTAGNLLSCPRCRGSTPCTGPAQPCASPAEICIAVYSEITGGMGPITISEMRCGTSSDCNSVGSYSTRLPTGLTSARSSSTCCRSDGCTPAASCIYFLLFLVPPMNSTQNGVSCPACITMTSVTSAACEPGSTMPCTGVENQCMRFSVGSHVGDQVSEVTMQGCATKSFCAAGSILASHVGTVTMTCTEGESHPDKGLSPRLTTGNSGVHISHEPGLFLATFAGLLLQLHS